MRHIKRTINLAEFKARSGLIVEEIHWTGAILALETAGKTIVLISEEQYESLVEAASLEPASEDRLQENLL